MKKVISTERIPIKLWLDDLEESALQQAINLANLPFAFKHVALMPDSHMGFGMPIGGVVATHDVIVPSMVGVDIGCVDKDTEFLSPSGWIKISQWSGEKVAQFNPLNNKSQFVDPIAYIKKECDEFIYFKTKYGIDQMISSDHRCLIYRYSKDYSFSKYDVVTADHIYTEHNRLKNGFRHRFLTSFQMETSTSLSLSNEELRVMVMVCADGSLESRENRIENCRVRLKKKRKIKRAEDILLQANIPFSKTISNGVVTFTFTPPEFHRSLSKYWSASIDQLRVISDEIINWDGNENDQVFFSRKKEDADFVQYVFASLGHGTSFSVDQRNDGSLDYRVFRRVKSKVGINGSPKSEMKKVPSVDGYQYCFSVPSKFLVLRRNGCIFVTGNCGMCSIKTRFTTDDIDRRGLENIRQIIKRLIPVGENWHKELRDRDKAHMFTDMALGLHGDDDVYTPIVHQQFERAMHQLGTLGGGNHFIEIQTDKDGYIWVMIHSGSRNVGYKVAEYYNKIAVELNEKYYSSIPKEWQLAFLPLDTEEAQEYIAEMEASVRFAFENRKMMLWSIEEAFAEEMKTDKIFDGERINIAHNYARLENHFGENVWVHRKGATSARDGEIGIIPGSQQTKSYIVMGKGNKESFMSCSHGSGRKMSRTKAKETLNLEEEIKRMDEQGILHDIKTVDDLDEAGGAYKDVSIVMSNQDDLVSILHELSPVAVVKARTKSKKRKKKS